LHVLGEELFGAGAEFDQATAAGLEPALSSTCIDHSVIAVRCRIVDTL